MKIQEKFDLKDRVAVVTGGAGLLGMEFCKTMAESGASPAVLGSTAGVAAGVAGSSATGVASTGGGATGADR